eukprot:6583606-Pyramimonas_sp.AAC.1
MCTMLEDYNYGLDSDENGQSIELCFAAEMSKVPLPEPQHIVITRCRPRDHYASLCDLRCKASCGRQGRRPPRES